MMDSTLPSQPSLHLLIYAFSKSRAVYNTVHELTVHLHKEKKKEKKYVLEKPTWACSSISSTIFYQYKTIHVCKMYKRILMLENNKIEGKE